MQKIWILIATVLLAVSILIPSKLFGQNTVEISEFDSNLVDSSKEDRINNKAKTTKSSGSDSKITRQFERLKQESDLTILKERVEEVRRDQLNYKIEKDILKNTYSSNLETINTIVTIVLVVIGFIGFLGVRSINSLKSQFENELESFRSERAALKSQLDEVEIKQKEAKEQLIEINESNKQQDLRLQILEIQEKVTELLKREQISRALDYLAIGLELSPDDVLLLSQKKTCFFRLNRLEDALEIIEKLLEVDVDGKEAQIRDMAETLLLLERFDAYDKLASEHKSILEKKKYLFDYLQILKYYLNGDIVNFHKHTQVLRDKLALGKARRTAWRYSEARNALANKDPSQEKEIFLLLTNVLEGMAEKEELEMMIVELNRDKENGVEGEI